MVLDPTATPATAPAVDPAAAATTTTPAQGGGDDGGALKAANAEAAARRVENKELKAQIAKINAKLGLTEEKGADDLLKQFNALKSQVEKNNMRERFSKVAASAGVNEKLAFGLLKADGDIDNMDVNDDNFDKDLKKLLAAALKDYPNIAVNAPVPKAGEPFDGNAQEPTGGNMDNIIRQMANKNSIK